ncbi:transposase family protein [Psychrobacter sanguinis]|uniref:transposase family protein n=1 Tax=Psychrobacter sanguinis TaxID=861445 RepID=UPI002A765748|nr:transposase family protein [Psychrobacter sanguinis]MDY3306782.1 transposase family protein [Psychrobacter sanguinis]
MVQIDHTPIDIILVDDKYRKPIGRPYLTVAIDVYSRVITGYYIALDAPSVTSVGMCIARSILRKNELLTSFGIHDATWDVFGKPAKIHVDNGSDFRAESLKKSCAFHGIDIEFRPLARPEYGGHIERLIGTLMKQVHGLPGTTFSNIKEKDEYNSEKHASLTLHELETWLLTYITKVYHETIHSSIGRTPNEQWRIGLFGDGYEAGIGIPAVPENAQTLMLDFMPSIERTIQRNGVTIDGIQYYNASLNNYINATENEGSNSKTKRKFTFRQDPRDISNIWFYDPALKHYFNIPLANQALPAMSLWEYKTLKNKVREQSGTVNEALIYQAWEDMQSLVESSQQATKSLRRQEQRRKSHKKSQKAYDGLKQEDKAQELSDKASITTEGKKADTSTSDIDLDDDLFYEDIE